MKDLGVSREQAEGGAGLLLGFAQSRLSSGEFVEIADTIPAISDLLGKAPRCEVPVLRPLRAAVSRWFGGLGGLYVLTKAFNQLELDKPQVDNFVGVLLRFFRKKGGVEIETLLSRVLR